MTPTEAQTQMDISTFLNKFCVSHCASGWKQMLLKPANALTPTLMQPARPIPVADTKFILQFGKRAYKEMLRARSHKDTKG